MPLKFNPNPIAFFDVWLGIIAVFFSNRFGLDIQCGFVLMYNTIGNNLWVIGKSSQY
jgi:hypothetical protein